MHRTAVVVALCTAATSLAQDWSATFPAARVGTYFTGSSPGSVVLVPAGDPTSGARDAAKALKAAIDQTGKTTRCDLANDDSRSDDLVVATQATPKADVVVVVRVFPAEAGAPPVAVVSFFAPDGTTLSAITGTKGSPIEARPEESASSVGVSREARKSISSVMKDDDKQEGRKEPRATPENPEPKEDAQRFRRLEVTLAPVGIPIPFGSLGDFGSLVRFGVHFTSLFGVYVTGFVRWLRTELEPGVIPTPDQALSVDGHLGAGVSLMPVRSKFFLLGIRAGLGFAATSTELRPRTIAMTGGGRPGSYGTNGLRPVGTVSFEFAFVLSPTIRFGIEIRNAVMSSETTAVNGCSQDDLRSLDMALRGGQPVEVARVSPACQVASFSGTDANGLRRANDVPLALGRTREPAGLAYRLAADLTVTFSF